MFQSLMHWMQDKKVLPQISDTEREALEAGHVWIDGDFFAGNPDFEKLLKVNYHALSAEEQAFMDGPVDELLQRIDGYEMAKTRRVPDDIMQFMREQGFFGLIVPKEYGGLGFSTLARSAVMAKVTPHSGTLSSLVVIPNTLGAAELLIAYGTDKQKQQYLPQLAKGEMIPCFGLTEPTAGSDAASIKAEGEVFKDAAGETQIRLNFRKRYITLAPIADLISLACQLHDPQNLLEKGEWPGISLVLLHRGTQGLEQGDRHLPIGEAFANGPLVGKDVTVPASQILGGVERSGQGWKMLMESLAGGRMVSLPATGVGALRLASGLTGAYSMVRQQFGMSVGQMEGVQAAVGRLAAFAYMTEAARVMGCSAVDDGIEPPVASAVMKAYVTELARQGGNDAMDVMSGAGVMQGPNNVMGRAYCSAPIAITVEGANIMTRTLMIFGQGATRSHPYAFKVVEAVERGDTQAFRQNLLAWMWQFASGGVRTLIRGLTRGWTVKVPKVEPQTKTYYRRLGWSAMRFGFLTNLALFFVGGKLKSRGNLTGRYADVIAWMLLGFSTLKRFEAEGRRAEDLPLLHYSLQYSLAQIQIGFEGIYRNFDGVVGRILRVLALPLLGLNPIGRLPDDAAARDAAQTVQKLDAQFERLMQDVYIPADGSAGVGRLMLAFTQLQAAQPALNKIRAAQKIRALPRGAVEDLLAQAVELKIVTSQEADSIEQSRLSRLAAIEVDIFTEEQFFADAGSGTPDNASQSTAKAA